MTQVPNHDSCAFHRKHVFSFFPNILRAWGSYSSPKSDTHTVGPLSWKNQKSFPKKSNEAQITLCEFLERKKMILDNLWLNQWTVFIKPLRKIKCWSHSANGWPQQNHLANVLHNTFFFKFTVIIKSQLGRKKSRKTSVQTKWSWFRLAVKLTLWQKI